MAIFDKIKVNIIDWATGNSQIYEKEKKVYEEMTNNIIKLEEILNEIILKGNFSDEWEVFEINNNRYTLPLLKAIINDLLEKNALQNSSTSLEYIIQLQEIYEKTEFKIKSLLVKKVLNYEEMEELYWVIIELKKNLASNIHLSVVQKSGFNLNAKLPDYEVITKLKLLISERQSEIIPYLEKFDFNKRK